MIPTNRLIQVAIQRNRLTLSIEFANYQSDNSLSQPSSDHRTGPRHKCPIEFARGALSEEFVSDQHDYVEGDRDSVTCDIVQVDRNIRKSCTSPDRNIRNPSRVGTPGVNEGVFSPNRGSNSSFAKWTKEHQAIGHFR